MHLDPFTTYDILAEDEIGVIVRQEEIVHFKLAVTEIIKRGADWLDFLSIQKYKQMLIDLIDIEQQVYKVSSDIREEVAEAKIVAQEKEETMPGKRGKRK